MSDSSPSGRRRGPSTTGVHGGLEHKEPGAPVVPPVAQSATFFWATPADGELRYTRYGNNPNQRHVASKMAELEGAEASAVLGSGMAASAMTLLALTSAGEHVVASSRLYGATHELLESELPRRGVEDVRRSRRRRVARGRSPRDEADLHRDPHEPDAANSRPAAPGSDGVETLVSQPRYTSHVGLTAEQREAVGIPDGFVRLSIGVEDAVDLVAAFERALDGSRPD